MIIPPPQFDTPSLIKIEEGKKEFSFNISSGVEDSRIITFFNNLETYFGFIFVGELEFSNFSQSSDNLTFNIDIGDLLSIYTINFFDKKTRANLKYKFSFFIPLVEYNYNEKTGIYAYKTINGQYILNGRKTSNLKVKTRFTKLSGISGKLTVKLKYYGLYI